MRSAATEAMRALLASVDTNNSRCLRFDGDYIKPKPGRGEVLIAVLLAGICGTDFHVLEGFKNVTNSLVLGHEFVGCIEAFGTDCPCMDDGSLQVKDRVVAEINCVPHGCTTSRTAYERAQDPCRTALGLFGRNGVFADFVVVPYENIHRVPDEVPDRIAVFTEPVAAACQILEEVHIPILLKVAVLGAGKLGWIVAKVLAASGKNVSVIIRRDLDEQAKKVQYWGVSGRHFIPVVSMNDPHFAETKANSYDFVVDCTGNSTGLKTAIDIVKPRGTIILKSTHAPNSTHHIDLTPVVVKEARIIGSRCGPFEAALRLLQNGMLNLESLISKVYKISDGKEAFEEAKKPGTLKILLQF